MAPTTKNLSKTEKKRKVLNVAEKLKILDLLKNGEKIAMLRENLVLMNLLFEQYGKMKITLELVLHI